MAKYEYEVKETKDVEVPGCPLCGSEDLKFWSYSRDCSMHGAAAGVKCKNCGHEVKVDGNELHMDWGEDCQMAAIEEWKWQVSRYGKRPSAADIAKIKEKLKRLEEENEVLKFVITYEGFKPEFSGMDYDAGTAKMKAKFLNIIEQYLRQS